MICKVDTTQGNIIQGENIKKLESEKSLSPERHLDALAFSVVDSIYSLIDKINKGDKMGYKIYLQEEDNIYIRWMYKNYILHELPLVMHPCWSQLSKSEQNIVWEKVKNYLHNTAKDHEYFCSKVYDVIYFKPYVPYDELLKTSEPIADKIFTNLLCIIKNNDGEHFCVTLEKDGDIWISFYTDDSEYDIPLTKSSTWENIPNTCYKVVWNLIKGKVKAAGYKFNDCNESFVIYNC